MFLESDMPGRQAFRRFRMKGSRVISMGLAAILMFSIPGCRKSGEIDMEMLAWDGAPMVVEREFANPSAVQLGEESFPALEILPRRCLMLRGGELKLLEFQNHVEAYSAFQRIADPSELALGFSQSETSVFFQKGRWLGMWKGREKGREWLQARLHLPGREKWGDLPDAFSSMLHQGRFPRSERILMRRFLDLLTPVPVFGARFDCRGDSAWIYSSPGMPSRLADSLASRAGYRVDVIGKKKIFVADSGWMGPIRLEFFDGGMVGVEGCFDTTLVIRWIQTQETATKSLKSRY